MPEAKTDLKTKSKAAWTGFNPSLSPHEFVSKTGAMDCSGDARGDVHHRIPRGERRMRSNGLLHEVDQTGGEVSRMTKGQKAAELR
jgi:hypothetical protein